MIKVRLHKLENNIIYKKHDLIVEKGKSKINKGKLVRWIIIITLLFAIAYYLIQLKLTLHVQGTIKVPVIDISTSSNSKLLQLKCYDGSYININDTLAVIEENRLNIGNSLNFYIDLQEDEVKVYIARKELKRKQKLFSLEVIVAQEVEKAKADYQIALAKYRQHKAELYAKNKILRNSQSTATNSIKNIYAPISGLIGDILKEPGEVIRAGEQIITILDVKKPWIEAIIPEKEINFIYVGQSVYIKPISQQQNSFKGKVEIIGEFIDFIYEEDKQGYSRTRKGVAVKITAPKEKLITFKPGTTVNLKFKKLNFSW